MLTEDFEEVLYQHKLNIKNASKQSNKLLFIDTDSFMTYYYRKHAGLLDSDEKESILDNEDNIRLISGGYDLVLFMESDVPYVQDDLRILDRNENGLRESCTEIIKELYKNNGINFKIISGSYSERLEKAQSLIKDEFGYDRKQTLANCERFISPTLKENLGHTNLQMSQRYAQFNESKKDSSRNSIDY